ncbi:MAG: GNAT family N-acetyltransferase [Myxococcales bacterium]
MRRLTLRAITPEDRAEYVRVLALSEALHAPWSPLRPPGDTWDAVFDRQLARHADGTCWKGVGVLPDGRVAGVFNLNEIVRGPFQNAYAGWAVNAELAGQGYAGAGVAALLGVAFTAAPEGLGLHRVQANIVPRNHRSVRVAERCGFRREGLAERYLRIAGVWEDHAMYAVTAEEWATR